MNVNNATFWCPTAQHDDGQRLVIPLVTLVTSNWGKLTWSRTHGFVKDSNNIWLISNKNLRHILWTQGPIDMPKIRNIIAITPNGSGVDDLVVLEVRSITFGALTQLGGWLPPFDRSSPRRWLMQGRSQGGGGRGGGRLPQMICSESILPPPPILPHPKP